MPLKIEKKKGDGTYMDYQQMRSSAKFMKLNLRRNNKQKKLVNLFSFIYCSEWITNVVFN